MSPDEMIAVIAAHRDGKRIEMRDNNPTHERQWVDACPALLWNFSNWEYRIKPEPPKPREWWALVEPNGTITNSMPYYPGTTAVGRLVHVREVLGDDWRSVSMSYTQKV